MSNEEIKLKMKMHNYLDIELALISLIQRLTDPKSSDIEPQPLFQNVDNGHPDNLDLFSGVFVKVMLSSKKASVNIGDNVAIIKGLCMVYVPGKDGDSAGFCKYLTDILEAFFDNLKDGNILASLNISDCSIKSDDNPQNWLPINVDPKGKDPKWSTAGIMTFECRKGLDEAIELTLPGDD